MDQSPRKNRVEEKLKKTTIRIIKKRRNLKKAKKETAEFKEIHKLLENADDELFAITDSETVPREANYKLPECSSIPFTSPGIKVFHDELIFCLFNQGSCSLRDFINCQEKCFIFGLKVLPSEDCFRKLIAYRVDENLMTEIGKCSSISLYVLYLMSVHEDSDFVLACFDFLKLHPFDLYPEDIFQIFINFGAKQEELFDFEDQKLLLKFKDKNEIIKKDSKKPKFPYFNMEMVGQILLHYITENFIKINSKIKVLVKGLAKLTLEPKVRSAGTLQALYSTLLTCLCFSIKEKFKLKEITSWVHLEEEHLLNQLDICRIVSKAIFPDLHELLVLKTITAIAKKRNYLKETPIKINYLILLLKKFRNRELPPLEFYSILQLINGLLPGLTATVEDSIEINGILASLERKISKAENLVDLIRLKLEIAKVGNLVTNNTNNRFTVDFERAGIEEI